MVVVAKLIALLPFVVAILAAPAGQHAVRDVKMRTIGDMDEDMMEVYKRATGDMDEDMMEVYKRATGDMDEDMMEVY
ncbi:hypothetical protein PEX1_105430 [Penicillium expansum]|nr:hypothetical protein PEX1_105430 [Penicillium expansum]